MALRNAFALVSTEAKQDAILASLATLLTELQQKLETGQAVALDAGTLAALETINAAVTGTVAVSNHPSDFPLPSGQILTLTPQTNALTDAQLRASAPAVKDDYASGEVLADQTGAGAVLTFTFTSPVQLVVVHGDGAEGEFCRADAFGGVPSATLGVPCGDEIPTFLPVTTGSVKVFAPASMVVSVWGYRRA